MTKPAQISGNRILLYSDTVDFGGHEIMTAKHLAGGCREAEGNATIVVAFNKTNERFHRALVGAGLHEAIEVYPLNLPIGRHRMLAKYLTLRKLFKRLRPRKVILLQGNPDACAIALMAAKNLDIFTVSYIPLPYRLTETGGRFARLRDAIVDNVLLPNIDGFVTVSPSLRECLIRRGVDRARVEVVPNGVKKPACVNGPHARKWVEDQYNVGKNDLLLLVVARVYFKQKGHDILLRELMLLLQEGINNFMCIIVGDGPDFGRLQSLVLNCPLRNYVVLAGWCEHIGPFYEVADVVIIPSRFEGVPLVMMEALVRGKVVFASDCGSMRDYLPKEWLFDNSIRGSLVQRLIAFNESRITSTNTKCRNPIEEFGIERRAREFVRCIVR